MLMRALVERLRQGEDPRVIALIDGQAAAGRRGQSRPGGPLRPRGGDGAPRATSSTPIRGGSAGARGVPCASNEQQ